jgi:hypothetical protein
MDRDRQRLDAALEPGRRPFAPDDVRRVEAQLGRPVPDAVRHLWSRFGSATIPSSVVYVCDAGEVIDLLEQYADHGLEDLLPIAGDGGGRDFAVSLVGRDGFAVGTVMLNDRSVMTEGDLQPVATDVVELVELARSGGLDLDRPDLRERWTEQQRAAAYRDSIAGLRGLGPDDHELTRLHHATLVPETLVPRRDLDIAGVPCAAEHEVHLDREARVTYATLARDHRVGDIACRAGSLLVLRDGKLHRFTPVADTVIEGLRWKGGNEITLPDAQLNILWGTLAEPTTIRGVPCAAARVHLDEQRAVAEATLARDFVIDGEALPAGTWFELLHGNLYAVILPVDATIRGQPLGAGEKHVL